MIAGLVLAAGASRRLGRNKLLLPYRGGTVLSATVGGLLEAPLQQVIVVLGHDAAVVRGRAQLPANDRLEVVMNEEWEEGMASSLRRGVSALSDRAEAVVVALGDQPETDPEVVRQLIQACRAGASLALPVHGDERAGPERTGHPVLFSRALFPELLALVGDTGAREVVKRHAAQAARIPAAALRDVDTEADYQALIDDEGRS